MADERPNILFICTDQQRYDALGCYGNEHIQTPAIDALAGEGVLFEQCYAQSPVCGPSRASLLTGQYVQSHGLWANGVALPAHQRLFTQNLADAGYDCGLIGKSHLAACFQGRTEPRRDDGFRTFWWAHDPSHGSPENHYHRWLEERFPELYTRAMVNGPGRRGHDAVAFDTMPTEAHYSRWVGDETVRFLREVRDPDRPFFFMVNFFDPHHPFVAPEEYVDRYDPTILPPPIGGPEVLPDRPPILTDAHRASYAGAARGFADHTAPEIEGIIAAYYAMVTLIDDEVRRILRALDDLGLAGETLVVFTSDHGEMLGDYGLLLKGPMFYDGAVRVPLILRWPGRLPTGERRAEIVEWIDLCSTCLDASDTSPLAGDQGQSLLPLARGEPGAPSRGWALTEYRNSGHPYAPPVHATMLRRGRYKL
ncbi:MAG TPA: sulfatase-like hydrolase/transferase, partial [Thermomicrobiales bacterium]|nr:sulfatase-like hydrolase/transferase [Thermomicrobiales bacterium]